MKHGQKRFEVRVYLNGEVGYRPHRAETMKAAKSAAFTAIAAFKATKLMKTIKKIVIIDDYGEYPNEEITP